MESNMKNQDPEHGVYAILHGSRKYPDLQGKVRFTEVYGGTIVSVFAEGLPNNKDGDFYGFHIHEGERCTGDSTDSFKNAGGHYNPTNVGHPFHAGDMLELMGNHGMAWCEFFTDRFYPEDVVGKTVIIHSMADDFRSQPSGDSGEKIACGVIRMNEKE